MIDVANDLGIPGYLYFASPAAYLGFVLHLTTLPDTESIDLANELTVPSFINPVPSNALPLFCINKDELGYSCFVGHAGRYKETKGIVVNTFRELEPYALESLCSKYTGLPPVYSVGPVVDHVGPAKWHPNRSGHEKVIQWLDQQPDCSVVFLCFGSMGSLNRAQMVKELGLSVEIRLEKGNNPVLAEEVERGVRELMDGGDGELKENVKEMSEKSKKALMKNGSSFHALENLMNVLLSEV
ncbi:hypothetical protein L1987_33697 [Smallanthus sonchifolius]|uniref:Uncharacterized protein n=1 Tax=Smallanthus sonchifolius TaxID=185202 RepID=A0ACB9HS66_9ASTR|nr:hypothetical protein L1987_33697 [Smallanthus sonchifolius]